MVVLGYLCLVLKVYHESFLDSKTLGSLATYSTIVAMTYPLAGAIKIYVAGSVPNVSLPLVYFNLASSVTWLVYGWIVQNKFTMIPNIVGLIINAIQVFMWATAKSSTASRKYINNIDSIRKLTKNKESTC